MTAPTQHDPNKFLMGSGVKSAKFETVGTTIGGRIVTEPTVQQQTKYKTGEALFFDNGDPKLQLVVKVQTDLREDPDDDGVRGLYLKGGYKRPTTQKAVADAVRNAGAQGLSIGGELYLTLTHIEGTGQDAPKSFTARYVPPQVGGSFLQPDAPTAQAPPSAPVAPAAPQQPVAAPVAPQPVDTRSSSAGAGLVQLPDGSMVTPEVAALLGQVQPPAA
jgi:hypothetical protein